MRTSMTNRGTLLRGMPRAKDGPICQGMNDVINTPGPASRGPLALISGHLHEPFLRRKYGGVSGRRFNSLSIGVCT